MIAGTRRPGLLSWVVRRLFGGTATMMGGLDSGLMMLGLLHFIIVVLLSLAALACGCRSLVLLYRHSSDAKRGGTYALIAVVLGVLGEAWFILFFTPWRFPNVRPLVFLPLPSLQIGLCGMALWSPLGSRGRARLSRTGRLMVAVAAIALPLGGVLGLQRWDRRRELLHWAEVNAAEARVFMESYQAEIRCYEHSLRGERCERCAGRSRPIDHYAMRFLQYAKDRAAVAEWYRRAADHSMELSPEGPPSE
jgi:hypothetical protein